MVLAMPGERGRSAARSFDRRSESQLALPGATRASAGSIVVGVAPVMLIHLQLFLQRLEHATNRSLAAKSLFEA